MFRSSRTSTFGARAQDENAAAASAKAFGAAGNKRAALGEIGNQAKKDGKTGLKAAPAPMETDAAPVIINAPVAVPVPDGVLDIDAIDADDPQLVATYVVEIHTYMGKLERQQAVKANYLLGAQKDITENMRAILLDWLVEVHLRFKLLQETLYLTVHLLDRFLTEVPITRSKLQLVGVTAMLIASKYEEMYPPEVRDFIWIADNAYSRAEIISMECLMLNKLDYNLGTPLPLHFLRRFSKASSAEAEVHSLSKYMMELSMGCYAMTEFVASEVAAAAMFLARQVLLPAEEIWTPGLQHFSGYSVSHMATVVAALNKVFVTAPNAKQQAVRRKYASTKLLKVSEMPQVEAYCKANAAL